jgi:hypothetical protein
VDNGFRVNLGPIVGIDNDYNQVVKNINRNTMPVAQQQATLFQAAAEDINNSTLSSSSFYDPKRYHAIMRQVTDNMTSTFKPGLSDQIFPNTLFNSAQDYGLDFLKRPMEAFQGVLNDPNFGKNLVVPLEMQQLPNGSVIPLAPEVGAEALHFLALGNLAPFYTTVNPRSTPQYPAFGTPIGSATQPPTFGLGNQAFTGATGTGLSNQSFIGTAGTGLGNQANQTFASNGTNTLGSFNTLSYIPLNTAQSLGMPNTPGTVNVYPLNFELRNTLGGYGIGAYNESNPIVASNRGGIPLPKRQ